jgi:superfamily II DNA or RNA helicase
MKKVITPYDYQVTFIDRIIKQLIEHRVIVGQLPTGGGKTVCFSLIIDRYLQKNPDKTVIILVHREELLEQAKATIDNMFPDYGVDLIKAGVKFVKKCHIYIGMVESVNTRAQFMSLLNLGLVIIDEAHIGNFTKMHRIFKDEYIIGFTATPISASKKTPMLAYYKSIVCGPSIQQLIAMKRLSQNITRCPEDIVNENLLQIDLKTGDFDIRQMGIEFSRPKYVMNTVMFYGKFCKREKTIVFNVNVEHSLEVTACFNHCGFPAKHIDGETPMEERRATLRWFAETDDAVLCNVGIANVGFDEPTVRNVIVNVATMSLTKWIQMCGRGSRYIASTGYNYSKESFNIIDLGGNSIRFGDWNSDRDWKFLFYNPDLPGKPGLAPIKICPQCKGLVHAAVIQCKLPSLKEGEEICGYIFDRKKFEEDQALGRLVVITKGVDIMEIMARNEKKKAYFTFFEMGRAVVDKIVESGMRLTEKEYDILFEGYFDKCKMWHEKSFPNKKFNEAWHRDLAHKHFYNYLKTKTNGQPTTRPSRLEMGVR